MLCDVVCDLKYIKLLGICIVFIKSLYVKYMKFNYMKRNWNGFG